MCCFRERPIFEIGRGKLWSKRKTNSESRQKTRRVFQGSVSPGKSSQTHSVNERNGIEGFRRSLDLEITRNPWESKNFQKDKRRY